MNDSSDSTESPSVNVAETVAAREGVDPVELEPLYDTIDPDALDKVVDSMDETDVVRFDYEGYRVLVYGDASVELAD